MAWVADPSDPKKAKHLWQKLTAAEAKVIAAGEEVLPLFPINVPDPKRPRRMHAGVIPTSSYDSFASAEQVVSSTPDVPIDLRKDAAHARVVDPFSKILPASGTPTTIPLPAAGTLAETTQEEAARIGTG